MRISIFENGMDSLNKGFNFLKDFEDHHYQKNNSKEKFFILKDAIINIHHGVEILLKQILINENELYAFSNIDKDLKNAIKEKREKGYESIFESSNMPHTVTFKEAVDRVKILCGIKIPKNLENKLVKLESYRNQVIHASIINDDNDILSTFEHLPDYLDILFSDVLGDSYITLSGYDLFKKSCNISNQDNNMFSHKKNVMSYFIKEFEKINLTLSPNGVKTIKDVSILKSVFSILNKSKFQYGMDLYNGFNSGDISRFKINDNREMSFFSNDIKTEYFFKINEILVFTPVTKNSASPLFIMHTEKYDKFHNDMKKSKIRTNGLIDCYEGMLISNDGQQEIIWEKEKINEIHTYDDDEYFNVFLQHVYGFSGKGVFCFINVQGLEFRGAELFFHASCDSLKQLEVILRSSIEKSS